MMLPSARNCLCICTSLVPLLFLLLGGVPSTVAQGDLPCLDSATGELLNDREQAIENGVCMDAADSVWFYSLTTAPICSNGLQEGAPTHVHLWWGSIGNPVEDAFDPENYGLFIEGGLASLTLEFSPHFIYNETAAIVPQPLFTTELAIAPANILYPLPCESDINEERGENVCGGWTSLFGDTKNTIVVAAPDGLFGRRALDVGVKFFHLHPIFDEKISMFNNANGTCDTTEAVEERDISAGDPIYCLFDYHCPNNGTCLPAPEDQPLEAFVTATLFDAEGNIKHKATQYHAFAKTPKYRIHNTNTGIAGREWVEIVNFQRVPPGFAVVNVSHAPGSDVYSSATPYAPRFYLFGPTSSDVAFPQTAIANLTVELVSDTSLTIFEHKDNQEKEQIGTCQLIQPEGANATILDVDSLGYTRDGPGRFGGTIMSVPIQVGYIPGKYAVACELIGGESATCNIVVDLGTESSGAWATREIGSRFGLWWHTSTVILAAVLAVLLMR